MKLSTFSIVARDPKTGQIAVAGCTNWFGYGRWVPHIEAGVGAIATQAETNMSYAVEGMKHLKSGLSAEEVVKNVLQKDPDEDGVYQLLILDNGGNTFGYTGEKNHVFAGHILKENLAVAGNTLVGEETLKAIVEFYENSDLPFGLKIIKALQAGQKAGGDIRGHKSAAIKIATAKPSGKYWEDTLVDLRVDKSDEPLVALENLYRTHEAYDFIGQAEESKDLNKTMEFYKQGLKLDPENEEIMFWMARVYYELGDKEVSSELMKKLDSGKGKWREFWKRLDKRI
jgi:uncharacterized Ntn-hydrolase superfamily protein